MQPFQRLNDRAQRFLFNFADRFGDFNFDQGRIEVVTSTLPQIQGVGPLRSVSVLF